MAKKTIAAILALALMLGCLPAALATSYIIFPTGPLEVEPTPAPSAKPYLYVEFKADSTVYKKAGSGRSDVVILKGSTAAALSLSKDKKWVKILFGPDNNWKGWVRYSRLKKASYDYPLINYASRSKGAARIDLDTQAQKLAGSRLKLRANATVYKSGNHSSKALGKLKKGLSVTATGKLSVDPSGVFYVQIRYKGKIGWVPETKLRGASKLINNKVLK